MKKISILQGLFVSETAKMGRGVFTTERIPKDRVVEVSPVVVMSKAERTLLDQTGLHDYIFEWGEPIEGDKRCCMALGYLAVYNHSYHSNCEYEMDLENALISVKAVRDIEAGEELFINYNGDWNNEKPVWFETV
jgi:SET domain-containing protein